MMVVEGIPEEDALVALYASVNWTAYSDNPESLMKAIRGSQYTVYVEASGTLVGFARAITDDESIVFLQDILVHPEFQAQGYGRALFERFLERFSHIKRKVLTTGEEPRQFAFYESLGFTNMRSTPLNAFVRIEGYSFE